MTSITLTTLPPSVNKMYRGKRYKTDHYKIWISNAGWDVLQQRTPKLGPQSVNLEIEVKRPDKRKRDLDNLLKPIQDLLVRQSIIEDDKQVKSIKIKWADETAEETIRIKVGE